MSCENLLDLGLLHHAHRGPHRHAHPLRPGKQPVHPALGGVGARRGGEAGAQGEGDHGDGREVGPLSEAVEMPWSPRTSKP